MIHAVNLSIAELRPDNKDNGKVSYYKSVTNKVYISFSFILLASRLKSIRTGMLFYR